MQNLALRSLLACGLLSTTGLSSAAFAQFTPPADIPAVHASTDQFGVNLVTRKLDAKVYGAISIGPGGNGGLSYIWSSSNSVSATVNAAMSISGSSYQVVVAGATRTFTLSGGVYTNDQGTGETLSYNALTSEYTYSWRDGTVVVFSKQIPGGTAPAWAPMPLTLTYPAGERLSWYYRQNGVLPSGAGAFAIKSVASSLGYQMRTVLTGQTWDRVVLFDMADETCDPAAVSCTLSGTWPTIDYINRTVNGEPAVSWVTNTTTNSVTATFPTGRTVVYSRDANDRVTSVTDGKGTWTYSHPAAPYGNVTQIEDTPTPPNIPRIVTWNTTTGVIQSDGRYLGVQLSYTYDSKQRITSITRNGVVSNFTYDARGNVTQVRQVSRTPGTPADIITSATFPASCSNLKTCNLPQSTTDARGNVTDYVYDPNHGGVTTLTSPAASNGIRPQSRFSYQPLSANYRNGSGIIIQGPPAYKLVSASECTTQAGGTCGGSSNEVKTTITYGADDALEPTAVTSGAGDNSLLATTSFTYTNRGDVKFVDGPLPGSDDTERRYYDASRRLIGTIGPDPDGAGSMNRQAVRTTYNGEGQDTKMEIGTATGQADNSLANMTVLQEVQKSYNQQGLLARASAVTSGTTYSVSQYSYTARRLPECTAIRMNPTIFGTLPTDACALGTEGSFGADRITKNVYEPNQFLKEVRTAVQTPSESVAQTNTWLNAQLATLTDGENNKTTFEYDGFGRLSKTRYPDTPKGAGTSSTTDFEQFSYDPNGNVTLRRLRDGNSISSGYDNLNRQVTLGGSTIADKTFTYDLLGRLTAANFTSGGASFAATYDALSRLITETGPQGTVTSAWDLAGRRTQLTYPGTGLFVIYDHLVTGEVEKVRENGANSGVGILARYGYDDLRRRRNVTFGNGVIQSFNFDAVSRLSSLTNDLSGTANDLSATFAYNPASQIDSTVRTGDAYAWTGHFNENKTGTPNGLNQLTAVGAKSLTHDARGNVTAFGAKNFTYNGENLLLTGPNSTSLAYDPMMRLQQVTSGATARFAYDGLDRIAEYDGSNVLQRRYVHGPGVDDPIVWYEGSGTTDRRFLSSDERGSIVSVTDSAGALVGINRFDEYGQPQSSNMGVFGYTGQAWLPSIGVWYYKARAYDSELGRFLQTDPIGYASGLNLYSYVRNDPVNLTDPSGLQDEGGEIVICGNCVDPRVGSQTDLSIGMNAMLAQGQRPGGWMSGEMRPLDSMSQLDALFHEADNRKGERNRTAKATGTNNPYKKIKKHPTKPGWVQYKDQNGKTKERPARPDELEYLAGRNPLTNGARMIVPFGVGVGMCLLAPATCGIVDVDGNGTLEPRDWELY